MLFNQLSFNAIGKYFSELEPHFDFNAYIGAQQEPNLTTKEYNVLGGMNVADVIQPDSTWYSHPASLSALGGIYGVVDKLEQGEDQSWRETFGDWYRNVKGIGIQRDFNPLGLLYDEDESYHPRRARYLMKTLKTFFEPYEELFEDLFK